MKNNIALVLLFALIALTLIGVNVLEQRQNINVHLPNTTDTPHWSQDVNAVSAYYGQVQHSQDVDAMNAIDQQIGTGEAFSTRNPDMPGGNP